MVRASSACGYKHPPAADAVVVHSDLDGCRPAVPNGYAERFRRRHLFGTLRKIRHWREGIPEDLGDQRPTAQKMEAFREKWRGTGTAVAAIVVTPFRTRLSAITLVTAMLLTGAASVFASDQTPPCPTHHHDCTQTTQLRGCCCIEQGDRSNEATPAGGKTQVAQPVADGSMVVTSPRPALPDLLRHARVLTTSPRSSPPDLVTLFGTFLI